jgi:ribulose-5-phosphate 4-epimerase/fuculose-1-phosphate aldolase
VHIHTELHRRRPDATVVVHNHPPYATALAAVGELPDLVHQNSSILADELVLVADYDGEVDQPSIGADLAERIGDASVALLVSHGVIVTAPTIQEAVYKSVLFERTCMLHWLIRAMDRAPIPIAGSYQKQMKTALIDRAAPVYWNGAVRQLVAAEPEVLT